MKKIVITDKKVLSILDKKGDISKETQKILDRMKAIEDEGKKLDKEFNIYLTKTMLLDEKARPFIKKIVENVELGEFEQISRVHQEDDGKWTIEIADRLEEFKVGYREADKADKAEKAEKTDNK